MDVAQKQFQEETKCDNSNLKCLFLCGMSFRSWLLPLNVEVTIWNNCEGGNLWQCGFKSTTANDIVR